MVSPVDPPLVYLDHAATTPLAPAVLEAMLPYLQSDFGNPNSLHQVGRAARRAVEHARRQVAGLLGCQPHQVVFTSGGTEGDNLSVLGGVLAQGIRHGHIITSTIEHHAVLDACRHLQAQGFEVTYLPVDASGRIDPDDVSRALRPDTALVSLMLANNEVGTLQPIAQLAKRLQHHPSVLHTDAVQAAGQVPLDVEALGVDLLTISAHKMYGPKGVGALYVKDEALLEPLLHGGGQERGIRPGTEHVAGIVGQGAAAALAKAKLPEASAKLAQLRDRLIEGVLDSVEGVRLSGHPQQRLPGSASFCFEGLAGESLLLKLDMHGVCVSTGSACTAGRLDPSHVLLAMGIPKELANGSIRMTLGRDTTPAQVDRVLALLPEAVAQVRQMEL